MISPMLSVGISRTKAFLYAALTWLLEVVGALLVGFLAMVVFSELIFLRFWGSDTDRV